MQETEGINGYSKIWGPENPHIIRQQQLLSLNVRVWRGVTCQHVTTSLYFSETINSKHYKQQISQSLAS
jgi:hypothetical protein